ncbi:MAG: hypothetical protein HQL26_08530 [Candidatus Omnitrophica bacterium]|nr:hypothetical protein [Candidatus Omnitrophota bacterium]
MKRWLILLLGLAVLGCSYQGKKLSDYIDDPKSIIKDPHFQQYKEERDVLESQYLKKEITYADYTQKMSDLDAKYTKEVSERDSKLQGPNL